MSTTSLLSTDLVPVATDKGFFLYFQKEGEILEVHTEDGTAWTKSTTVVGDKAQDGGGSPITAYFVKHDGTSNAKDPVPAVRDIIIT
jgi:hypothetical protein